MPDDDLGFRSLTRTITRRGKLSLDAYKSPCIKRRIATRMRACGVQTYHDYEAVLSERPDEWTRLEAALTINVTSFYRNPETWRQLESMVLPELFVARQGRVRVWSAGCASGEEPYTLAILLADVAKRVGEPSWLERVRIDATDIDEQSLTRARRAQYPASAFKDAPAAWKRHYLRAVDTDFALIDVIRAMVRIGRLDLTREPPPRPPYDLILCRNVVIYFDRPMQERLLDIFTEALRPGGLLVLGKVEVLWGSSRTHMDTVDVRERIFRRSA
jgi:chemotaxis methyl-accepting protein methylase